MSTSVVTSAAPAAVEYPSSDGKPMAENDAQALTMIYARNALAAWFARSEDVYVSGDLLIYYEEGNPRVSIAPDVFVVYGVAKRRRMTYLLWEEGKAPDFVLEVASPNTWREDEGAKRQVYERLGVTEYCQYDPTGELLGTQLKGSRLSAGRYQEQAAGRSDAGEPTLSSAVLKLDLFVNGEGDLRFRDPATGDALLTYDQEAAARRAAEARAEREIARRRAAEARIAEMERLLRERHG
jgi:Uma2 family endonuclease